MAIAIGEPYLSQWPEMKHHAVDDHLAMVSIADWRSRGDISDLAGNPPEELCQPEDWLTPVARGWPSPRSPYVRIDLNGTSRRLLEVPEDVAVFFR